MERLSRTVSKGRGHSGKHQCWSAGRGTKGKNVHKSLYCNFPWEGTGKVGLTELGLVGWNNFGGLWGVGTVPSCRVPGPGVFRAASKGQSVKAHGGGV